MEKEKQLICPICGNPTNVYMGNPRKDRLCRKHGADLKNGLIIDKGNDNFVDAKTGKSLITAAPKEVAEQESKRHKTVYETRKCISCGKPTTNGFFFCPECYRKFKDKRLLLEIINCTEIDILDDSYEGKYTCHDGHVVKSKAEVIIDNYLFDHGIPHAYEKALDVDGNPEHDIHPDFFLPSYNGIGNDLYLEFWGLGENNIKYTKSKKYKIDIYKKMKLTVICLFEKDLQDSETSLKRHLDHYKVGIINNDN